MRHSRQGWAQRALCCVTIAVGTALATMASGDAGGVKLRPTTFTDLPGWSEDAVSQALPALHASCKALGGMPADARVGRNHLAGTAGDWRALCRAWAAAGPSDTALRRLLQPSLLPFAVADAHGPHGPLDGLYWRGRE